MKNIKSVKKHINIIPFIRISTDTQKLMEKSFRAQINAFAKKVATITKNNAKI